jgi:hypothetical protein
MYRFEICNLIKLVCFLKFVVYKINSEMIKYEMMVLTGWEKTDVADTDVSMSCMLYPAAKVLVGEIEREI